MANLLTPPHGGRPLTRRTLLRAISVALAGGVPTFAGADAGGPRPKRRDFLRAIERGDLPAVRRMLSLDATLAATRDGGGRSAYVISRLAGETSIAALIREQGIELDIVEAALAGDWDRMEALAAANPGLVNRAHPIGGNLLYAGAIGGGSGLYRLRALGADSNGRPDGGSGFTPARGALAAASALDAWLGAVDVLGNGGEVNAKQARGDSVLHAAVARLDTRLVRLAVRKGADLAAEDADGRTAFDLAKDLDWPSGQAMLENPEQIARDYRGSRLAFTADRKPFVLDPLEDVPQALQSEITGVSHFNPERVAELLQGDARLVHAVSTDAELAIEACGHTGHRDNIRRHLDHGAPLSLPTALSLGDLDHARWLLEADPRLVNERGPHDLPVTWYVAIGADDTAALELLIEFGADVEQESAGETALHHAAFRNRPQVAAALLDLGADPGAVGHRQDPAGATPYTLAERRDSKDVLELFRARGIEG